MNIGTSRRNYKAQLFAFTTLRMLRLEHQEKSHSLLHLPLPSLASPLPSLLLTLAAAAQKGGSKRQSFSLPILVSLSER